MRGDRPLEIGDETTGAKFPPHARGSTLPGLPLAMRVIVSPACAGIDPNTVSYCYATASFPRMRGDRPFQKLTGKAGPTFPPHARGSTSIDEVTKKSGFVSPACAGIDLERIHSPSGRRSFPRMRGDRPWPSTLPAILVMFPPHARGSTFRDFFAPWISCVSPACAGIDLIEVERRTKVYGFPRMRGDRPQ